MSIINEIIDVVRDLIKLYRNELKYVKTLGAIVTFLFICLMICSVLGIFFFWPAVILASINAIGRGDIGDILEMLVGLCGCLIPSIYFEVKGTPDLKTRMKYFTLLNSAVAIILQLVLAGFNFQAFGIGEMLISVWLFAVGSVSTVLLVHIIGTVVRAVKFHR